MTQLRQRIYRVTVGELQIGAPARVSFDIDRGATSPVGKATLQIWNLSASHQRQIEQLEDTAQVVLESGHESTGRGLERVFSGHVFRGGGHGGANAQPTLRTERSALDAVSHVEARDGGAECQRRRSARTFGEGVSFGTIMQALVGDLGVGNGNLSQAVAMANEAGAGRFDEGYVISGQTSHEITRLLSAVGLRWSIQHGAFQALRGGEPLQTSIVRLAPSTGLIESPVPGTRGRCSAKAIMTSDIWPGRALLLESQRVEGRFTVRSMKGKFDSHGNDNQFDLELAA